MTAVFGGGAGRGLGEAVRGRRTGHKASDGIFLGGSSFFLGGSNGELGGFQRKGSPFRPCRRPARLGQKAGRLKAKRLLGDTRPKGGNSGDGDNEVLSAVLLPWRCRRRRLGDEVPPPSHGASGSAALVARRRRGQSGGKDGGTIAVRARARRSVVWRDTRGHRARRAGGLATATGSEVDSGAPKGAP